MNCPLLFISENPLHVVIRSAIKPLYDDKDHLIREPQRRLYAKFERGLAPGWARQIGEETFAMLNRPPEVPTGGWLAAFDTEAADFNDEERAVAEERLQGRPGVILVEKPRLVAPYPKYDQHRKIAGRRTAEHVIADITAAYEATGFNVGDAVAYEQENGGDPAVVAALEGLVTEPTVEDEAEPLIAA